MRRATPWIVVVVLLVGAAWAGAAPSDADRQGIIAAATGYMDGALDGDADRVAAAVHPELTKVTLMALPGTGRSALRGIGSSRLVELVRAGAVNLDQEQRNISVEVHDARVDIASARVVSSKFCDYLQLARIDGVWKIVNVLWIPSEAAAESESAAEQRKKDEEGIRAAALDYLEGYFTGDAERVARGVHPELTKVTPRALPPNGKTFLDKLGAGLLVEYTRTKGGLLPEDQRHIAIEVYDVNGDVAAAGAMSSMFHDYLQLARIDGRWRIVNVLWTMNPAAPVPGK